MTNFSSHALVTRFKPDNVFVFIQHFVPRRRKKTFQKIERIIETRWPFVLFILHRTNGSNMYDKNLDMKSKETSTYTRWICRQLRFITFFLYLSMYRDCLPRVLLKENGRVWLHADVRRDAANDEWANKSSPLDESPRAFAAWTHRTAFSSCTTIIPTRFMTLGWHN
jgi:hypothetical protein